MSQTNCSTQPVFDCSSSFLMHLYRIGTQIDLHEPGDFILHMRTTPKIAKHLQAYQFSVIDICLCFFLTNL